MVSSDDRPKSQRWTRSYARWVNLALMLWMGLPPLASAVKRIFWPSVWIEKHAAIEGLSEQRVKISLQGADWVQRIEAAAPNVVAVALVAWPGYLLLRSLLLDQVEIEDAFTDDVARRRRSAASWCTVGASITKFSLFLCNVLLERSLGSRVSLETEILFTPLILLFLSIVSSVLVHQGRRLRTELDQVI